MSIDKLVEFAKDGDKNLDNLDVSKGFLQSEKPERQWFNKLFGDITGKINEVVDNIDGLPFEGGVLADTFVTITQNSVGTVPRNLHDFVNDSIHVNKYGNFTANPRAVLQLAIDKVSESGGGEISIPAGVFDFSNGGVVLKENVTLRCAGSGLTIFDQGTFNGNLITTVVQPEKLLALSSDLKIGDVSNIIANNCQKGDFIRYLSTLLFTRRWTDAVVRPEYYEAEMMEVLEATANKVTFTKAAFVDCRSTDNPSIVTIRPTRNMQVIGLTLRKSASVINDAMGLVFRHAADCWYDDIVTENYDDTGIMVNMCARVNGGKTHHVGGSETTGLTYGVNYANGTRDCHQVLISGDGCRHAVAGGGSWAVPAYITVDHINAINSKNGALDTHASSAYFTYKSANVDIVGGMSGLGHKMLNVVANGDAAKSGSNSINPYEGGVDLLYQNIKGAGHGRFYSNHIIINSTFDNVEMTADKFSILEFADGSKNNTFNNTKLICPKASNAANSVIADACHTVNSAYGMAGLLKGGDTVNNLYVEGFVSAVPAYQKGIKYKGVKVKNCGWVTSLGSSGLIIITESNVKIDGVSIKNTNTKLDWGQMTISVNPSSLSEGIELKNIDNSDSVTGAIPLIDITATNLVSKPFIFNVHIKAERKQQYYNAVNGTYIHEDLSNPVVVP